MSIPHALGAGGPVFESLYPDNIKLVIFSEISKSFYKNFSACLAFCNSYWFCVCLYYAE